MWLKKENTLENVEGQEAAKRRGHDQNGDGCGMLDASGNLWRRRRAPNRSFNLDRLCGEEWLAEALNVKCQGSRALRHRGSTAKFSLSDGLGFACT